MPLSILRHSAVDHWMTRLRDRSTPPREFRLLCRRVTVALAVESTRDLAVKAQSVETPLETFEGCSLTSGIVLVPVLRAGLGMLDVMLEFFPDAAVGFIGLERNHQTAEAERYYGKIPPVAGKTVLVLDPMLATGGSAQAAVDVLVTEGATDIRFLAIVAAPEGVALLEDRLPKVSVFTAALDRELNDQKYILPGLGDFGDRLYGTPPAE